MFISSLFYCLVYLIYSCVFCFFQGLSQRNELSSEVGVVGQRVTYSNGTIKSEEEPTGPSPPLVKPAFRESVRALKPAKGQSVVISYRLSSFFLDLPDNNTLCA